MLIVILLLVGALRGYEIGLVRQAGSFVGLAGGLALGAGIVALIDASLGFGIIIVLLAIVVGVGTGELFGIKAKLFLHERRINKLDKTFGAALGVVTCAALVWLGSALASGVPSTAFRQGIRDSRVIMWLDSSLPPATDVLSQLERSLAQTGLPDLFGNLEPSLPDRDAPLPDIDTFNAVIENARTSVVEIEGRSCQGIGTGSGFVAAPNYIVTNAHVVAGMRQPYVRDQTGRQQATVAHFDPDLDIAVLRIERTDGQALDITPELQPTGTAGVVLGYPSGGPFAARPAVIVEQFTALGRDIYEDRPSERHVYALRADVEPGNSGGPLLDQHGDVIGLIFARSTTYAQVGYALTTPPVLSALAAAQATPSPGQSLRCS